MALDECRRWKMRKCIAFTFVLCDLENTVSHKNKNRELSNEGGGGGVRGNVNQNVTKQYGGATTWLIGHRRTKEMFAYVGQKV